MLETYAKSGGYILGFRVDPQDRISEVYKEIHSLFQIYSVGPIFGVDFSLEAETPNLEALLVPKVTEDTELIEDNEDTHAIAVSGLSLWYTLPHSSVCSYQFDRFLLHICRYLFDSCPFFHNTNMCASFFI